jgi:hypothetical protein
MQCARRVRSGFFPLDEELALLPGQLTPRLQQSVVRLGTWMPFAPAAETLAFFTGVQVSEPTVRRVTEGSGAAYVAVQTAAVEAIEQTLPAAPVGPPVQLLSVDGAMVPLIHKAWAEVKTLAVGTVGPPVLEQGEWVVHTGELSYFSRLADAERFGRLALVETHRRGTETAHSVCAVSDGAEWIQGFVDLHRPDAVRILDFPHALGYVAQAGHAVYGEGTPAFALWFARQRQTLKQGEPAVVLRALRRLVPLAQRQGTAAAVTTVQESVAYLEKRRAMLAYARFQAQGYPIGSGSVESANKVVMEARLKGAGMHWARSHVNPLVALRTIACSDRWAEAWPQIVQQLQQQAWQRRLRRLEALPPPQRPVASSTPATEAPVAMTLVPPLSAVPMPLPTPPSPLLTVPPAPKAPNRPPPDHPWRRFRIRQARPPHHSAPLSAKL